jgi:hypothetical protein
MAKSAPDATGPSRYYANPQEQKILIQGLQNYFILPERSQHRNKIAKDVSRFLRFFSPHWTHRAVRLWFNNNRHTYFPSDQPVKPERQAVRLPVPPSASPKSPEVAPAQPSPSEEAPPAPEVVEKTPPGSPQTRVVVPESPVGSPKALSPGKPPPESSVTVVPLPAPQPRENGAFQFLMPVSFWPAGQSKEQTPEQLYIPMSSKLNELRRTPDDDPRLPSQIRDFDNGCLKIISKFGTIKPEKIEPMLKYVRFPFPMAESSEFKFGLISESISSEFSEFALRAPSFTQQLYAADLPRDFSSDHFASNTIWQSRPFEDVKVGYFERAALTTECAAFVTPPISTEEKLIQFLKYREPSAEWQGVPFHAQASIDAMKLAPDMAWILCDSVVRGVPFNGTERSVSACLNVFGSGSLALFGDGVVVGFPTASVLYFIKRSGQVRPAVVHHRGIACVGTVGDSVVCGVSQSGTMRLIHPDGRDDRAFIGHCGPVMEIERMSDVLFASRGDDETVRVWDIRQRNPISSVLLPHVSVCSMAGSSEHLICGFHNKRIGVVELRKDHGKAVLGVQTQDYMAAALSYDGPTDHLAMFGVVDKEPIQTSMVFVDNDGNSRQRVFRRFANFIGSEQRRA